MPTILIGEHPMELDDLDDFEFEGDDRHHCEDDFIENEDESEDDDEEEEDDDADE